MDNTTAHVEREKFTRMSVEVDLSKPLLPKFRLHGRVWRIQYEGLRLICFECGQIGHKEDCCPLHPTAEVGDIAQHAVRYQDLTVAVPTITPEYMEEYGSWMLVKKPH